MVGAVSLATVSKEDVFTSLSRKIQQLSPMKWDKHTQLHLLSAPACTSNLLTALAQSSTHISGDTSWDASVSPVDEPVQEMSGMALEQ